MAGYNFAQNIIGLKNSGGGGGGDSKHHYSTSEHIVGYWIDNKPIYEQTFDFGANGVKISQGSTAPTTISSAGIDILISSEGISPTYKCWAIIGAEKGDYIDAVNQGLGEKNVRFFTFRYTKTGE